MKYFVLQKENHVAVVGHRTKRPFSVIFKSTLTKQVSRYKHEGQV